MILFGATSLPDPTITTEVAGSIKLAFARLSSEEKEALVGFYKRTGCRCWWTLTDNRERKHHVRFGDKQIRLVWQRADLWNVVIELKTWPKEEEHVRD